MIRTQIQIASGTSPVHAIEQKGHYQIFAALRVRILQGKYPRNMGLHFIFDFERQKPLQ